MQIKPVSVLVFVLFGIAGPARAQSIPKEIWGKWTIQRELPTKTISCWGEADAKKMIGTQIEYSDKIFRWDRVVTNNPTAEARMVTADQFSSENSSPSSNGSQVDFRQLGIAASKQLKYQFSISPPT